MNVRSFSRIAPTAFAFGAALNAFAHNHITVDTLAGNAGDPILIVAGYLPGEEHYSIVDGRLMLDGVIAEYEVSTALDQQDELFGWFAADELVLTSDFYLATGRLDGGHFHYELAEVHALEGHHAEFVWGVFDQNGLDALANSGGASRLDRSFEVGAGGHQHGQGYAFSEEGVFDVTFIVWDSLGRYTDSEPVQIRFVVGEGGGHDCPTDLNGDGVTDLTDLATLLAHFGSAGHDHDGDINGDGLIDLTDLSLLLTEFGNACE